MPGWAERVASGQELHGLGLFVGEEVSKIQMQANLVVQDFRVVCFQNRSPVPIPAATTVLGYKDPPKTDPLLKESGKPHSEGAPAGSPFSFPKELQPDGTSPQNPNNIPIYCNAERLSHP